MSIITIASGKGGCGKTTVAQTILSTLAIDGYRVAAIDTDLNQTLAKWCLEITKYKIDAIAETDETKIISLASELESRNDLVVIDTAGAAAQAVVFAIGCADLVLIPAQLSSADLIEAVKMRALVGNAAQMSKREIPHFIVLTDYQPNTKIAAHVEKVINQYLLPTLQTKINHFVAFKEMTFTGEAPTTDKAGAVARELVDELAGLGALPFLRTETEAVA